VRHRVLVVDDDPRLRGVYRDHLSSAGFQVRMAASLGEACRQLAKHTFDAVIVDVSLSQGGVEGLRFAGDVRQRRRGRPVLVLTSYGAPAHATAAARLGVDAFLHKPVSLVWLERLLSARIEGRRLAPRLQINPPTAG
jgi:DNA-binding response OmpR family regulator